MFRRGSRIQQLGRTMMGASRRLEVGRFGDGFLYRRVRRWMMCFDGGVVAREIDGTGDRRSFWAVVAKRPGIEYIGVEGK